MMATSGTAAIKMSLLPAFAGLLWTAPAAAFRTAADLEKYPDNATIRWEGNVLEYEVSSKDIPGDMSLEDVTRALRQSTGVWENADCSFLRFELTRTTDSRAQPNDGRNTVQFIKSGWGKLGYAKDAAGATDVLYTKHDGQWSITEADVYINAEGFKWTLLAPEGDARSLHAVLAHEAGHMLGLLHPCEPNGAQGAPDCAASFYENTLMFPLYESLTYPTADDEAGLCALYGTPFTPHTTDRVDAGHSSGYGLSCSAGSDCESDICFLSSDAGSGICTFPCAQSDCPANAECVEKQGTSVCIPTRSTGSCTITVQRTAGRWVSTLALSLLLLFRKSIC
jgi:hypothetical protein